MRWKGENNGEEGTQRLRRRREKINVEVEGKRDGRSKRERGGIKKERYG
jgi:hypothetical protein